MSGALLAASVLGGGPVPQLTDLTDPLETTVQGVGGNRPVVSVRFNSDGTIDEGVAETPSSPSYSEVGQWLDDLTGLDNTDWEVLFTIDSEDNGDPGTWTGSTTGSYQELSANRTYTWTKNASDAGTANSEVTVSIRQKSDNANIATRANLSYNAIIDP